MAGSLDVLNSPEVDLSQSEKVSSITIGVHSEIINGNYRLVISNISSQAEGLRNQPRQILQRLSKIRSVSYNIFDNGQLVLSGLRYANQEPIRLGNKFLYVSHIDSNLKTAQLDFGEVSEN